jgi:hypothetical protein
MRSVLALFLFAGALQLMKTGAADLAILEPGGVLVRNAGSTLGLGWLGALIVLSGSPIAATALTLVEAGRLDDIQGFTMLTGSRLGAAFVVLLTAVIYAWRSGAGGRMKPVSTAVMALYTTFVLYVPAAVGGFLLLRWGPFESVDLHFGGGFADLLDFVYGDLIDAVADLPGAVVFVGGLLVLLGSFKILDGVLPHLDDEDIEQGRLAWLRRKWPMFGLGCAVALVTMSVSVALTVLVPLVAKGYAKREDIVPYIMGANITTLGDTLLAAFALNSAVAVRIVLAGMIATTILSVLLLAFFYPQLRRSIWRAQRAMVKSRPRLLAFTAALFAVPLSLIAVSTWFDALTPVG